MKTATVIVAIITIFTISAFGQGFLNLNFESAYDLTNPPANGELVPSVNALPDWIVDGGGLTQIYYVSNILGREQDAELLGGNLALSGNFSVELFGNSSISQSGLVPANAESLEFEAYGPPDSSGFSVSLGGQTLSYSAISYGADYDVFGANIPPGMDGQMEALTFSCFGVGSGNVVLDNIEFSTTGTPEPSEWALIGLGTFLFGIRRRLTAKIA